MSISRRAFLASTAALAVSPIAISPFLPIPRMTFKADAKHPSFVGLAVYDGNKWQSVEVLEQDGKPLKASTLNEGDLVTLEWDGRAFRAISAIGDKWRIPGQVVYVRDSLPYDLPHRYLRIS